MKTFTLLFSLLFLSLGLSQGANGATAFTGDCGCKDSDNELDNGGFESGTANWTFSGDGSFGTDTKYSVCGNKNGLITGSGTLYQEASVVGGSKVNLTVYGGTHNTDFRHRIFITFYNGNTLIPVDENDHNRKSMNYQVTNEHKLQQYSLWENAPANANKVRISFSSNGNYFKIDVACLSFETPEPVVECCRDEDNAIKNGSFEDGTKYWEKGTTSFGTDDAYNMCGSKNGLINNPGTVYQDVEITGGSKVSVTAYGGTHNKDLDHFFKMEFYNGNTLVASVTPVPMDYKVTNSKLKQFSISGDAPDNATKVRFILYSEGDYFKVDVVCMTVTPPSQCETCSNNRLSNAGFETGTSSWDSEGNVTTSSDAKNCGDNGLKLTGAGRFYQNVAFQSVWGSSISLMIWGAKDDNGGQKFQIFFLDDSNKELGKIERDVSKIFGTAPKGLEKYVLAGAIPAGTKVIRIQGSATSGVFRIDQGCLTFSGSPLPVTLAAFDVKKEGNTASLRWSTTYETNSDHFDIQHSRDGKTWNALTTMQAQGESKGLITYHYTHTNPLGVNLYRLKMVDADGTFAYSAIRSLNFDSDAEMAIYPNPTSDRIKFSGNQVIDNVKVYNVSGVMVLNTLPNTSNEVDLTKLVQGTYFVKVNNSPVMRKVLVIK